MQSLRLRSNENLFGPPPAALEAIREHYRMPQIYPDPERVPLRVKLAEKYNVSPEEVALGAGSVELIDILIRTFCRPDEHLVFPDQSFVAYSLLSEFHNRYYTAVPLKNYRCDTKALLQAIDTETRLVFIANPNNPTSTIISHRELEEFLNRAPSDVLVAVDEAYCEYVTDPNYPDTLKLLRQYPNLVILRTFSKIYGLAGLRIGYAIGREEVTREIRKNQMPFTINYLAAHAALAALSDEDYILECRQINAVEREFLYREIKKLGFTILRGQGNFLYMPMNSVEEKEALRDYLLERDIIFRDLIRFGHPHALRLSTWHHEASERVVEALAAFKKQYGR